MIVLQSSEPNGFNPAATSIQVNSARLKVGRHRWKNDSKRGKFASASGVTTLGLDALEATLKVCHETIRAVKVVAGLEL